MKKPKHIAEAKSIGDDSWELQHFEQLPKRATIAQQVEALENDQKWQEGHINEISRQIDYLIKDIQGW